MIEIKDRHTGVVLYVSETASTLRECLLLAIAAGANLSYANLSYANLDDANLRGADLSYANLGDANLRYANLGDANLRYANLRDANLRGADLSYANLRYANLRYANLRYANLRGADLSGANLGGIKEDIYEILSSRPDEVSGLLAAIKEGRVDGSTYEGECACLVGTLANVAALPYTDLGITPNEDRPAERFFLGISKGDTPATNPLSAIAAGWVEEWIAAQSTGGAA